MLLIVASFVVPTWSSKLKIISFVALDQVEIFFLSGNIREKNKNTEHVGGKSLNSQKLVVARNNPKRVRDVLGVSTQVDPA